MEQKQNRQQSPQYFLVGLVVALGTTLMTFESRPFQTSQSTHLPSQTHLIEDEGPPVNLIVLIKFL